MMENKEKKLIFEVLSVLLMQDSITINTPYQDQLIKECRDMMNEVKE